MTWTIVVNPHAGSSPTDPSALERSIEARSLDAEIEVTASPEDLDPIVRRVLERETPRLAVVGGDGTLHHAVNALMRSEPTAPPVLALIPDGSGSDFARTFAQPDDPEAALDRLVRPNRYPVDVGVITGSFGRRYFLNAANSGIAAASVAAAERFPRQVGPMRYRAAFWTALAGFPKAEIEVGIDRHRFAGEAINVVVANGQFFGGGLNIAPRATLVDGVMDVQVFSGPKRNAFVIMPRLALGAHLTHRAVRRYIGSTITIAAPDTWPVEADGELLGTGSVSVDVLPAAIDYVV